MSAIRFPVEPEVTMETVLRLPAVRRGAPELLAGSERLAGPVRWAHSCEARHIAGLLEGGELLLMTGMGLRSAAADQRAFVRELVEHRVAGLLIELGRVFATLPGPLVDEARRLGLPLVALHREVRFVAITEQLHTALLGRRTLAESRVAALTDALLSRLLDGAGVAALLETLAGAVGNPVVLERAGGEVVFRVAHDSDAAELLAHLRLLEEEHVAIARDETRDPFAYRTDSGSRVAAAQVRCPGGSDWGRLVVVGHERDVDALTRLAVERVAPLVALALRRAGEEAQLRTSERGKFLHDLVTGAITGADAAARAAEFGAEDGSGADARAATRPLTGHALTTRSPARAGERSWLPVAAAWRGGSEEELRADTVRGARRWLRERGLHGLVGTRPAQDDLLLVLGLPPGMDRRAAAGEVAAAFGQGGGGAPEAARGALTLAVAAAAGDWDAVAAGLRLAADTAHTMRDAEPVPWHDATEADVGRLLWGLREDPQVAAFARQRLRPVLEHDRRRSATLLPTLRALSDCHWHKARAARRLGIQRQSLYARIERLYELLGADLDDPAVRLGLDLAVRAHAA